MSVEITPTAEILSRADEIANKAAAWSGGFPPKDIYGPEGNPSMHTGDYATLENRQMMAKAASAQSRHLCDEVVEPLITSIGELADRIKLLEDLAKAVCDGHGIGADIAQPIAVLEALLNPEEADALRRLSDDAQGD